MMYHFLILCIFTFLICNILSAVIPTSQSEIRAPLDRNPSDKGDPEAKAGLQLRSNTLLETEPFGDISICFDEYSEHGCISPPSISDRKRWLSLDVQSKESHWFFDMLNTKDGSHTLDSSIDHGLREAGLDLSPALVRDLFRDATSQDWVSSVASGKELSPNSLRAIAIVRAAAIMANSATSSVEALVSSATISPRRIISGRCNGIIDSTINTCKIGVKQEIDVCKRRQKIVIAQCKDDARAAIALCKDNVRRKISSCKQELRHAIASCKIIAGQKIDRCKKDVQSSVDSCKEKQRGKIAECKQNVKNEINKCKKKNKWAPWLCEVGRLFPPGVCEPQRLGLPVCELDRARESACEAQRPILLSGCESNRYKIPGCEFGRTQKQLESRCEAQRPQLISQCEAGRGKVFSCNLHDATVCCEVSRLPAEQMCLTEGDHAIPKIKAQQQSLKERCKAELFGKSESKLVRRHPRELSEAANQCALDPSLRPQQFSQFNNLQSLAQADAALVEYEQLIRGPIANLVHCTEKANRQ